MTRPFRPRAVVFDFDGTLIDSMPLVLEAIAHALEPFDPRPEKEILARLGGPPERFLGALLTDLRNVPVALQRMNAFHHQNAHLIRPFEGARRLLERMKARAGLGMWTGRDRESADRLLTEHQLAGFFSAIVCGDDLPTHKPDPEGLKDIMRRLEVTPAETLFVGDADVDVLGGAACGVATLLIQNGREVAAETAAQAWRTVESPLEALEVVLRCLD